MAHYGGIDLGGTKIQAIIADEDFNILGSARQPTPTKGAPGDVIAAMAMVLRDAAHAAEVSPEDLVGVGVGSPGTISDGVVSAAHNLPGWSGSFPLAQALGVELGCPVKVANDVDVATNAEFRLGAGRGYNSLLGVFWGTGIGGGLILNGQLWSGRGAAGEIGHIPVEKDGALCTCGRRGCMEAYAGRLSMENHVEKMVQKGRKTELIKLRKERKRSRLTSGIWVRALKRNDRLAAQTLDRAVDALGFALASAVNVLDVEAIVLGGGLGIKLGRPYAEKIMTAMLPHLVVSDRPPPIHVATLGDFGGALGAALLLEPPLV